MTRRRWERVRDLFEQARHLPEGDREAFVRQSSGEDDALVRELMSLLRHAREETFLEPLLAPDALADAARTNGAGDNPPTVPAQIGPYRIIGILGEGAMGVVYEAEQSVPHRVVALKVLRPHGPRAGEARRRFEREIEALGRLDDPGIVRIVEAGELEDGRPWLAMERVKGMRLDEYTRRERPDRTTRIRILIAMARSVHAAHRVGVLHRDLKPGNVLVDGEGRPRLVDFGLARLTDDPTDVRMTETGRVMGTAAYMSPEQVAGDNALIDTRSDVYALGVIMYEVLAETLPYEDKSESWPSMLRAITEQAPRRLSHADPSLRGDLETIALKALEKDPARRYDSAAALADDLERALGRFPILARPPTRSYLLRRFVARHRLVSALALLLLVIITASAIVSAVLARRFLDERDLAREQGERNARLLAGASVSGARLHIEQGSLVAAQRSLAQCPAEHRAWEWNLLEGAADPGSWRRRTPEGTRGLVARGDRLFIVSTPSDAGNQFSVRLYDAGSDESDDLSAHRAPIVALASSADGSRLATCDQLGLCVIWDLEARRESRRLERPAAGRTVLALSPDGSLLALAALTEPDAPPSQSRGVEIIQTRDGAVTATLPGVTDVSALAFSSDGRWFATASINTQISLWNARSWESHRFISANSASIDARFTPDGTALVSAHHDGALRFWSTQTGDLVRTVRSHPQAVRSVVIGKDTVASIDGGGLLVVRDLPSGEVIARVLAHAEGECEISMLGNGEVLSTFRRRDEVRLWDLRDLRAARDRSTPRAVRQWAIRDSDGAAAWIDDQGRAWRGEVGPGAEEISIGREIALTAAAWDRASDALVVGTADGAVVRVNGDGVAEIMREPDGDEIRLLSPGALAAATARGSILRIDRSEPDPLMAGQELATDGAPGPAPSWTALLAVEQQERGVFVLAGTSDGRVHRIGPASSSSTRSSTRSMHLHEGAVHAVALSPDGSLSASAGADGVIWVTNMEGEPAPRALRAHSLPIYALSFAPDTSRLASGGADAMIRLWDPHRAEETFALPWPRHIIRSLNFRPGEAHLALHAADVRGAQTRWARLPPRQLSTLLGHAFTGDPQELEEPAD